MKQIIITLAILISLIGIVSAASVTREFPSTISPGQEFTLIYKTDATGNFFNFFSDDVTSGGCTIVGVTTPTHVSAFWNSPSRQYFVQINAPASGSCTFTGWYIIADSALTGTENYPKIPMAVQTVTIGSSECSTAAQCVAECKTGTCSSGKCSYVSVADGTACTSGTCTSGSCVKENEPLEIPSIVWIAIAFVGFILILSVVRRK